jgi:hypothetical protein
MLHGQSMLAKVLNDYCNEAGIPAGHPAREYFGRHALSLYNAGVVEPAALKSRMNDGHDAWLGEACLADRFNLPELSALDQLVSNNVLPGSDRRGRPA